MKTYKIPVTVTVEANTEVEARQNVSSLLNEGLPYCANPGQIQDYTIRKGGK